MGEWVASCWSSMQNIYFSAKSRERCIEKRKKKHKETYTLTRSRAYVVDLQIGVHRDNDPPLLGLKPGHQNRGRVMRSSLNVSGIKNYTYAFVDMSMRVMCVVVG